MQHVVDPLRVGTGRPPSPLIPRSVIGVNVLDRTQHSASTAWRTIQRHERGTGIVAIGGIQGIIRIALVGGIERVVGAGIVHTHSV